MDKRSLSRGLGGKSLSLAFPWVIGGTIVPPGQHPEILKIEVPGHGIGTATLIAPRVLLTAAHNADEGQVVKFSVGTESYTATIRRSPHYPKLDHDIAVGVINREVENARPVPLGTTPRKDTRVLLFGYGCTDGFISDQKLRVGANLVHDESSGFDFVTRPDDNGVTLCAGDSGGPGIVDGKIVGVNSKGNYKDRAYLVRLDSRESREFLEPLIAP